ncbi:MAG: response regulator transcription factor [Synergistales bacterium]|nr:response regulator transcription factor [Synergistales bacterium]
MVKIRVVLADDHRLFRDGLKKLLELEADIEVVGEAGDGFETIKVVQKTDPDILLLDVSMPNMNGIQVVKELKARRDLKFIAITAYSDEEHLSSLSAVGVQGYILKASGMIELLSAIRSVARGEPYVDRQVAGRLLTSFHKRKEEADLFVELTPKEKEVLYWLAQGMSNADISSKMVLSEKTVKNHVSHVLKKLELRDRTQAAVLAWKVGLPQVSPEALQR